jgi:hypothetical protein
MKNKLPHITLIGLLFCALLSAPVFLWTHPSEAETEKIV